MPTKRKYAHRTEVPVEQSITEIRATLKAYGCDGVTIGERGRAVIIGFMYEGRQYRLKHLLPDPADRSFTHQYVNDYYERELPEAEAQKRYDAEVRRQWRVLLLVLKGKFELVADEGTTVRAEFLAMELLPSGETVEEWLTPQLDSARALGHMPDFLGLPTPR